MEQIIKCNNKSSWRKNYPEEWQKAYRLGLLPGIYKEMGWKISGDYPVMETADEWANYAKKQGFISLEDWRKRHTGSYSACSKLKIQREVAKILGWKTTNVYSKFTTVQDWVDYTKTIGAVGLKDWQTRHQGSYAACCKLGIQREVARALGWKSSSNYSSLITAHDWANYAKKHGFISVADWANKDPNGCTTCRRKKLHGEVAKILEWKTQNDYQSIKTVEGWVKHVKELGAIGLTDWQRKGGGGYNTCRKLGLQREVAKAMGWKIKGDE